MKLGKITAYSDKLLKGFKTKAFLICLALLGTELFFRLTEAALCSLMLYFGELEPVGLFTGRYPLKSAVTFACTALRWLATAPLTYAAACRFTGLCTDNIGLRETTISEILLERRTYVRSLSALLWSKASGVLFALPIAFFSAMTFSFASEGISTDKPYALFLAVHAAVMTSVSVILWLRAKLAMLAVPYLMIYFPEKSMLSLVRYSLTFMKGRRLIFIKLFAYYLPAMLPVVTIPFILPKLRLAASLCISIFIKEDEYHERNKAYSGFRATDDSSELSWKNGRFTPPPDEAQA